MSLLPCPFCGGSRTTVRVRQETYCKKCRTVCDSCEAAGPTVTVFNSDQTEQEIQANKAWNTRPQGD
jgi:Lar family restriction alleviation protein